MTVIEQGVVVEIISSELDPYINTSKLFTVTSNKPYEKYDGWIEISNEQESIITQNKFVRAINRAQ